MIERILLLAAASLALAQTSVSSSITSAVGSATPSETASSTTESRTTWTVDVGLAQHTFAPDVTQANVGDIVEFEFFPTNHSVIRAEYMYPCVPYEMTGKGKKGFYSGSYAVDAVLDNPPKFQLLINDTLPIFYYCGAPGSCINWQMVGVINPNASVSLQKQKQAAKDSKFMLLPGENWPDEASSSDPMGSDAASSSTDAPTSATTTPAESSSGGGSSLGTGAIAGIAVGGTVAVIAAAALIFFCGRASRRKHHAQAAASQQQPLMQQRMPFSPGPQHQGHMSYIQPGYGNGDMNKHFSVQSHQMHSAALPGYIPQGADTAGGQTPLYGPSDALNPGANGTDYAGSPQQSPHMGAVGMGSAPAYSQRSSMHPQPFSPAGPQSPYGAPIPQQQGSPYQAPTTMPGSSFHEMPAAPVPDSQYQEHYTPRQGGSELSGSDTLNGRGSPPPGAQGGGIMNFIKQNTGGK